MPQKPVTPTQGRGVERPFQLGASKNRGMDHEAVYVPSPNIDGCKYEQPFLLPYFKFEKH